jgi:hypothetical protein
MRSDIVIVRFILNNNILVIKMFDVTLYYMYLSATKATITGHTWVVDRFSTVERRLMPLFRVDVEIGGTHKQTCCIHMPLHFT